MLSIQSIRGMFGRLSVLLLLALPMTSQATSVRMQTVLGPIDIFLYDSAAPRTVANFLEYANTNSYGNSFIHRSAPGFTIQGGGYFWNDASNQIDTISTNTPIASEFSAARSNRRGTIAMAKVDGNLGSSTSQWFINLVDNGYILDNYNGGYTVFGEVSASSLSVVDAIARLPITNAGGAFSQLPIIGTPGGGGIIKSNLMIVNSVTRSPNSYQGLWWNANESGWGMSVTQHADVIFAAIYTYDGAGLPTWYVIPNCPLKVTESPVAVIACTGDIYAVTGASPPGTPWNGAGKVTTKVGSGTLTFPKFSEGTFNFDINGIFGFKAITEQIFAAGSTPPAVDYTDLWWNPGESGWGISLTQQFGTIFAAWYTYDDNFKAVWYVVPNCPVNGAGCSGALYRVSGGEPIFTAWNGTNPAVVVGNVTFAFSDVANGAMNYTINGVTSSRAITRQTF